MSPSIDPRGEGPQTFAEAPALFEATQPGFRRPRRPAIKRPPESTTHDAAGVAVVTADDAPRPPERGSGGISGND
jgi:hypothetical protein